MRSEPIFHEAPDHSQAKKSSVETSGDTSTAGSGRRVKSTGRAVTKFRQPAVGVRRSPRAHMQSLTIAASDDERTDEEGGPEAVVNDDTKVTANAQLNTDAVKCMPATTDDEDTDVAAAADDDVEADEVVDVVENNNEDDSTTRSLSASLSPYEARHVEVMNSEEHEMAADWPVEVAHSDVAADWPVEVTHPDTAPDWLCDDADTTHNSLLFDADAGNSMSSEADSVDVVDDRQTANLVTADDTSPALLLGPTDTSETQLQDLEEFVNRTTDKAAASVMEAADDVDGRNVTNLSSGSLSESSEIPRSPQPASTSTGLTHGADVRRGAMWRDSLFPSDFPPEPTGSCVSGGTDAVCGKSTTVGKPDERGSKTGMSTARQMMSLDWESDRQNVDVDVLSAHAADNQSAQCATSSSSSMPSSQSCRQNFPHSTPPVSNPHYHYANKSLDLAASDSFRYNSGRRSVSDTYSRGPTYDVANSSTQQHQRPSSVRPAPPPAAGVDAHRLSHMWPGAPLPAHQHHVSLSHLQQLVTDDFQYAAPSALSASVAATAPVGHMTSTQNSAEFVRPCHQQQRQHGSRQQHKTHHKQTTSSTNQPVPASLAAAAAAGYDMFSACRIQQPISYFPHQGAAAALPMGVVGLHHAQMAVAAAANAANFGQPMPAGQAANSAMYSAAAAAAYSYLNGGGLQPFNVDINSVMRR